MSLSNPATGFALIIGFGLALGFGARFLLRLMTAALSRSSPGGARGRAPSRRASIMALVFTFALIFGIGLAVGTIALPMLAGS